MDSNMKRSIILDNYSDTSNRCIPEDASNYIKINSNNSSCIDNIDIYVKLDREIITDIKYYGEACVIALSSSSILAKMFIGKDINTVKKILKNYFNMINELDYDRELLGEALVYDDIYKQPSRKTCATLFARGINDIINIEEKS